MVEVFDLSLKKQAILQNASEIEEYEPLNNLSRLTFVLPRDDPKVSYCKPFHFVRFGDTMYRILPLADDIKLTPTIKYECEHVIATLIDDVMPGDVVIGNLGTYTADVLRFLLNKQTVKHWTLGVCEFARQFEYGWSDESLLSAMFSVPNLFVDPYRWEFDTTGYPWVVSLKALNTEQVPQLYVRKGKNLITLKRTTDPTNICTRLYAKGYGEGVNALTFADINGGKPYIDSPKEYLDKYGLKSRFWVDRRYESKESLLQAAKAMLKELQEPGVEYEVEFAEVDEDTYNKAIVGAVVKVIADDIQYKTYIVDVTRKYSNTGVSVKLTIANRPKDIASSVADLADRQRIEMTYAQGATQLYAQSLQANCDSQSGAEMQFYIPNEMRIVNSVKVKIKVDRFRAYSKATDTKEQQNQTSSSGGGGIQTSSSGGGGVRTSSEGGRGVHTSSSGGGGKRTSREGGGSRRSSYEGGKSTQTSNEGGASVRTSGFGGSSVQSSSDGGGIITDTGPSGINVKYDYFWTEQTENHSHRYRDVIAHQHQVSLPDHVHQVEIPDHTHRINTPSHTHEVNIPNHTHEVDIPNHTHEVDIPDHTHRVDIPDHTHKVEISDHNHKVELPEHSHEVTIPSHNHEISPGIYRFGNPSGFSLYVDDMLRQMFDSKGAEIDITPYLINKNSGKINRGVWHSISVVPNDLAYVYLDMYVQGFVQSRGDNTV